MRTPILALVLFGCGSVDMEVADTPESESPIQSAPPDLVAFGKAVRAASDDARRKGSASCGAPIPPSPVATEKELATRMLDFVSASTGLVPAKIKVVHQTCGTGAGLAPCANIFENDVFHNDGRMGSALYPFAQRVDRDSSLVNLSIYTPTGQHVVVATAGIHDGWLMGLAFFDHRANCPGSSSGN